MRIIPAMDVMNGIAVRGVGGRRAEYRPLVSTITDSTDPVQVADALRARCRHDHVYLADLDAIGGAAPDFNLYRRLRLSGARLWVDAGIRDSADAEAIAETVDIVVVGLETLRAPLQRLSLPAHRVAFSVDMKDERPIGNLAAWGTAEPLEIVERVVEVGVRRIIILDLARVGSANGVGCQALCTMVMARFPDLELIVGGGIRGRDDIRRLEAVGIAGVLVASALHDGRL